MSIVKIGLAVVWLIMAITVYKETDKTSFYAFLIMANTCMASSL